jgi:hypothetical protein
LAYVFGAGNSAFFVTDDDDVFGLGSNNFGCLGFVENLTLGPRKLDVLCGMVMLSHLIFH